MKNLTPEYIKETIEKIRISTIAITNLNDLAEFENASDTLDKILRPVYDLAYSLLKSMYPSIYPIKEEDDEVIYSEFITYLSSEKYNNIDDFIKWLEKE